MAVLVMHRLNGHGCALREDRSIGGAKVIVGWSLEGRDTNLR
jgi:hypothetical protein